jgi:hypothetical protein
MKQMLAVLLLWPGIALADRTVETRQGEHIILRSDGTYEILGPKPDGCKEPEKYLEIDYHYRGAATDMIRLQRERARVCLIADVRLRSEEMGMGFGDYKYPQPKEPPREDKKDGTIIFQDIDRDSKNYLIDNCVRIWCRAIVYGEVSLSQHIRAHRIDFLR